MRCLFMLASIGLMACGGSHQEERPGGQDTGALRGDSVTLRVQLGAYDHFTGCYRMTLKKDTAWLSLTIQDKFVNGYLRFNWFERDGNDGTLHGEIKDGVIRAWYRFQSEGLISYRQEIFRLHDTVWTRARGALLVRNDSMFFQDPTRLQFDTITAFRPVDCQQRFPLPKPGKVY